MQGWVVGDLVQDAVVTSITALVEALSKDLCDFVAFLAVEKVVDHLPVQNDNFAIADQLGMVEHALFVPIRLELLV